MNKSKIQKFAVDGHKLLYKQIAQRAYQYGIRTKYTRFTTKRWNDWCNQSFETSSCAMSNSLESLMMVEKI